MESIQEQKEISGEVIFRRKFGKHLCFLSITNKELTEQIECVLKAPEVIKEIIIGDVIKATGEIVEHKGVNKLEIKTIEFLKKGSVTNLINEKRQEYIGKLKKKENQSMSLCRSIKKGLKCNNPNCIFRHEILTEEEKQKIESFRETQRKAYQLVHEGDPLSKENKNKKSSRNTEFADFLVKTFGIETIKKGIVLDIAGGKGLTSFYLTTKYGITCKIIDPRGVTLPKKHKRTLQKNNLSIEENRIMFTLDTCHDLIQNCSLIIGMHPDEATVDIVNVALTNKINFAVVPCCVFHSKFPDRVLKNGKPVVEYNDIVEYILEKDNDIKVDFLNIEGRNKVLYKSFTI